MPNQRIAVVTGIAILMMSLSISPPHYSEVLKKQDISMEQFGGGGTFEAQCSKSSFEDVFSYTWAEFNVTVADNWRSAQIDAMAWVNGTMADDFRAFLDGLLDGLVPSGGDGWLSSDEREAVRSVAADCVEYTMTRVGVRDGEHHRGGAAVDWRNATWVEDGVSIDEWNMVPERHSTVRDCSSFGSSQGCYEVPVVPNSDRDCDTDRELLDECRIELYLSGEVDLYNIQSLETLTLAMNVSNISRATYTINAPFAEGMRLSLFEECEGRDLLNGDELDVFDELGARWTEGDPVDAETVIVQQPRITLFQALFQLSRCGKSAPDKPSGKHEAQGSQHHLQNGHAVHPFRCNNPFQDAAA